MKNGVSLAVDIIRQICYRRLKLVTKLFRRDLTLHVRLLSYSVAATRV